MGQVVVVMKDGSFNSRDHLYRYTTIPTTSSWPNSSVASHEFRFWVDGQRGLYKRRRWFVFNPG
jgi:hypothetical protein